MSNPWKKITSKELGGSAVIAAKAAAQSGITVEEAGENYEKSMKLYYETCRKLGVCKVEEVGKGE